VFFSLKPRSIFSVLGLIFAGVVNLVTPIRYCASVTIPFSSSKFRPPSPDVTEASVLKSDSKCTSLPFPVYESQSVEFMKNIFAGLLGSPWPGPGFRGFHNPL